MPDLVGVDEGVLCFRKTKPTGSVRFFLWNSVTNQSVKISVPNVVSSGTILRSGFCFHKDNQEFCIVLIWSSTNNLEPTYMSVFSSFNRKWSDVSEPVYDANSLFDSSIHIDGKIYWLSSNKDINYGELNVLVSFDVKERTWSINKIILKLLAGSCVGQVQVIS
ncbi:F-box/kelch-repeat protein [Senna tora]|uniref:F-box/kelch-repeat protein n=1 Tax=Senna tora TaxID=362788 RepID=A0A834WCM0_9FABA|nr:F-box/kelch-repeat protein [Senna tora]